MNTPIESRPLWKKLLPYIVAVAVFIALTLLYCSPILEGKVLYAGDTKNWEGMAQEARVFNQNSDEPTYWTGSMFAGMPTYQITSGKTIATTIGSPLKHLSTLFFSGTLAILLGYFIGFFILLKSFKVNVWVSIVGALSVAMSSYFFLIIPAGHLTKAATIGLMAPVIAGFYLIFQKKYGWGVILTMVYTSLGFMQHPQMSYYICMLIGILFFAELYLHIKNKRLKDLCIGIVLFVASMGVGLGTGYDKYTSNNEYVKETMRGGHSELAKEDDATQKTSGLDLDYATAWSYGIDETMTFLIPGFKGNASGYNVGRESETYNTLVKNGVPYQQAEQFCQQAPTYWGTQPFTAGPVYMGAIVCFLFVLGLFVVKGPYKWALLVATIFSILLSWGHNFMSLTRFFFDYFPLYDKFRAVSSILIVAEITIPMLGFLAIKSIMDKALDKKQIIKYIYISSGITAGICLIFALVGKSMLSFSSPNDASIFAQIPEWLTSAIVADRASILQADAFRSFLFIALSAILLWLYTSEKLQTKWFVLVLGVLVMCDMLPVDKRFFNDKNFVSEGQNNSHFVKQPYEEQLLAIDSDPNYRVMNLATNTFNDSRTSYYFKSIGGYHAAKLRRYQDLIDQHISKMNMPVLNMLNTKYFFVRDNSGQVQVQRNPEAMGNAWYIDSLVVVNTPNEESDALNSINLRNSAVIDGKKFGEFAESFVANKDSSATVKLLSYAPNKLEYTSNSSNAGTIIFSEIYYPYGWKAFIDDNPVEHFRANYALRALNVPAGEHNIRFIFDPDSVRVGTKVAIIFYIIMYATILGFLGYFIFTRKRRKENTTVVKSSKKA